MEAYIITIGRWKDAEVAGKTGMSRAIFDLEPGSQGISRFTPEEPWGNAVANDNNNNNNNNDNNFFGIFISNIYIITHIPRFTI